MFVSAFGAVSFVAPDSAEARWGRRAYYRGYPARSVYWGRPYRSYYRGPFYRRDYYAPRYSYGPRYYGWRGYYADPYYYGPRRGFYFRYGY